MSTMHLLPETENAIRQRLGRGEYGTVDELILAGLGSLDQQSLIGDFSSGELASHLATGEASIAGKGSIPATVVLNSLRQKSARISTTPVGSSDW